MHHLSPKFFVNMLFSISLFSLLMSFNDAHSKSIFLNGTDISNIRNQHLKKVDMFIDPRGNIIVQAPHYQVHLVDEYTPLQLPLVKPSEMPTHKPPQEISHSGSIINSGESKNVQIQAISPASSPQVPPLSVQKSPESTEPSISSSSPSAKVAPSVTPPAENQEIPLEKLETNLEDERLTPKVGSKTAND